MTIDELDKEQTLLLLETFVVGTLLVDGNLDAMWSHLAIAQKLMQQVGVNRATDLLNALRAFAEEKGAL